MSETQAFRLDALGQPLCRMAQALFAPDALPACPLPLHDLQADPTLQISALFLPLPHFARHPDNVVPQPPESAAEPRPNVTPALPFDWQAKNNTNSGAINRAAGLRDAGHETRGNAQTFLSLTSDALFPAYGSNAPQIAPEFPPGPPITPPLAAFRLLSPRLLPPTLPTELVEETPNNAAKTTQATAAPTARCAVPDVLHALRALTTTARTSALPSADQNHRAPGLQTLSANPFVPLESALTSWPNAAPFLSLNSENDVRNAVSRETQTPLREAFAPGTNGLMRERQGHAGYAASGRNPAEQAIGGWGESLEATPSRETTPQAGNETMPLRLTREAAPLAAMLQTLVQPALPADLTELTTNSNKGIMQSAAPFTSPNTVFSERQAARVAPAFVPTFEDLPNNASPLAAPSPDIDALIQALEEHLELEFRRAYGTSGR